MGAGPGDPELLTLKARRLLATAECILYDNLANHAILDYAPATAEKVYVGKKKSLHSFAQSEITAMLVERAQRGLSVVRLKGGDPYIFGRGGEEAEALFDAGIPFEVVPGVTSPLGIAAYAGVPLTHRSHTSVVTFVTGHSVEVIDWSKVGSAETLVILMGLTTFPEIAEQLIANGRSPDTPAIAVRWATRPDQETFSGTLATLPGLLRARELKPPTTIIVGEVVRLREKLNWYERLPLFGRTVVVTRPREQAASLAERFHALGANVVELPTIEIRPASDREPLDGAIRRLESYDWLIFTSANGVKFFLDALDRSTADLRSARGRIAAIGPATAEALERCHLKVDVTAEEFVGEGLLQVLAAHDVAGKRVLMPRAAVARDTIPAGLKERGAQVDVVSAYETVRPAELKPGSLPRLRPDDWVTFTSSSTVTNFVEAFGAEALRDVRVATIGPVTSATLRKFGIEVTAEASVYTTDGVVETVLGMA